MGAAQIQFQRIAGQRAVVIAVVAVFADMALVIGQRQAVLADDGLQPTPANRLCPAQLVAPVTATVTGQRLVFKAAY